MRLSRLGLIAVVGLLASAAEAQERRDLATALDGRLVQLRDGRLAAASPRPARYVAFYFGASWCGPCRLFVPELRRAYPELRARGIEVVFVSDDADCGAMRDYITRSRMAWLVVACDQRSRLTWLQTARGKALPGLLIYDAEGRRIATSWSIAGHSRPRQALAQLQRLASSP